jgi:hypothetical protein
MPRGRPKKQPLATRITSALDIAQEEVNRLLPVVTQESFVPEVIYPEVVVEEPLRVAKDVRDDYEFARTNLHGLLEKGNKLLSGITNLAEESDHPRTFEVAGNILKVLFEGTRELMTLQKDIRDVEKKNPISEATTSVTVEHADEITNNTIVATTMDMLEVLQEMKRKKLEEQTNKEIGN